MRRIPVLCAALGLAWSGVCAGGARASSAGAQPWAWGADSYGQLGNGSTVSSSLPLAVPGISSATAVAAGFFHSLALLPNGTVEAWGENSFGELGNGSMANSTVLPGTVTGLTGATAISAGFGHSMALLSNGAVDTWGLNNYGQLGDLSTTNSDVPVEVFTRSVNAIAAGFGHSLALSGGQVYAWGLNSHGQLGSGSTTNSDAGPGHSELVLSDLRPLHRGRYTLILHARRRGQSISIRRAISVS